MFEKLFEFFMDKGNELVKKIITSLLEFLFGLKLDSLNDVKYRVFNTFFANIVYGIVSLFQETLLDIFGTDLTWFQAAFPILDDIDKIIVSLAISLCLLSMLWQLFRSMGGLISGEVEEPWIIIIRTALFIFLIFNAKPLCDLALNFAKFFYTGINDLDNPLKGSDFASEIKNHLLTGDLLPDNANVGRIRESFDAEPNFLVKLIGYFIAWIFEYLIGVLLIVPVIWNYFKLVLETVERYVVMCFMYYSAPLALSMGASKSTNNITKSWARMYASSLLMLIFNALGLKMFASFVSNSLILMDSSQWNYFGVVIFLYAFLKALQHVDEYMGAMGISVAKTGGMLLDDVAGSYSTLSNAFKSGESALGFIGIGTNKPIPTDVSKNPNTNANTNANSQNSPQLGYGPGGNNGGSQTNPSQRVGIPGGLSGQVGQVGSPINVSAPLNRGNGLIGGSATGNLTGNARPNGVSNSSRPNGTIGTGGTRPNGAPNNRPTPQLAVSATGNGRLSTPQYVSPVSIGRGSPSLNVAGANGAFTGYSTASSSGGRVGFNASDGFYTKSGDQITGLAPTSMNGNPISQMSGTFDGSSETYNALGTGYSDIGDAYGGKTELYDANGSQILDSNGNPLTIGRLSSDMSQANMSLDTSLSGSFDGHMSGNYDGNVNGNFGVDVNGRPDTGNYGSDHIGGDGYVDGYMNGESYNGGYDVGNPYDSSASIDVSTPEYPNQDSGDGLGDYDYSTYETDNSYSTYGDEFDSPYTDNYNDTTDYSSNLNSPYSDNYDSYDGYNDHHNYTEDSAYDSFDNTYDNYSGENNQYSDEVQKPNEDDSIDPSLIPDGQPNLEDLFNDDSL